jgi:hypothetical protein
VLMAEAEHLPAHAAAAAGAAQLGRQER